MMSQQQHYLQTFIKADVQSDCRASRGRRATCPFVWSPESAVVTNRQGGAVHRIPQAQGGPRTLATKQAKFAILLKRPLDT
ncbi:hypothetical protein TNCV_4481351 [Trichonephila clavipes]|nr:hypothetical protein TNCV_4481351 [Trichonephila clavipes]